MPFRSAMYDVTFLVGRHAMFHINVMRATVAKKAGAPYQVLDGVLDVVVDGAAQQSSAPQHSTTQRSTA